MRGLIELPQVCATRGARAGTAREDGGVNERPVRQKKFASPWSVLVVLVVGLGLRLG